MQYIITAQRIAEIIAYAKIYDGEKISTLLQSLPVLEGEPVGIVVYKPKMLRVGALNQVGLALPDRTKLYTHSAPFTPKSIVEKCAQICESRFRSLMSDNNITAGNEAKKCASAVRHHGLTYPITPITADMVTDEMVAAYGANFNSWDTPTYSEQIEAAVNAYMGSKK
jgi:hypothetical protein